MTTQRCLDCIHSPVCDHYKLLKELWNNASMTHNSDGGIWDDTGGHPTYIENTKAQGGRAKARRVRESMANMRSALARYCERFTEIVVVESNA